VISDIKVESIMVLGLKVQSGRPGARRPIDLFSEIMDLRARADSAFNAHDHLPRVVVVGDQVCFG
jgi:hypothetical protein